MSPTPERPIAVAGASGRLGRAVLAACADAGVPIAATLTSAGWGAGTGGEPGVLVDASRPAAQPVLAEYCARHGTALLSCVSGRSAAGDRELRALAERVPVLVAANLSPLHWAQARAAELAAALTAALLPDAEYTVIDRHPRTKRDAPSATARTLAALLPAGTAVLSERFGAPVSDHRVLITAGSETWELTHAVRDLRGPAAGALRLAAWLEHARPGLYRAADVYAELAGVAA